MTAHAAAIVVPPDSRRAGAALDLHAHLRAIADDPALSTGHVGFLACALRHCDSRTDESPERQRQFRGTRYLPAGTQAGRLRASLTVVARSADLHPDTVAGWLREGDADYAPALVDHLLAVQRPHRRLVQLWLPLTPLVRIDRAGVRSVCARTRHTQRAHAALPM